MGPKLDFGDQPYGLSANGATESITALTTADMTRFYADHYGPQDSALLPVGDPPRTEAEELVRKHLGKWNGYAATEARIPPPPMPKPTHIVIVDKPGAPQAALYAFGLGIPRSSSDADIPSAS